MADETQFEGKASARNRLVDLFAEARALITAGLEAEKPVRRKFKKKADFVREALSLLEGRVAGEIAEEEMDRRFNELLDRYSIKLTPPPAWLDPKWASAHIRWLKAADAQLPGSAREFLLWQQSELALPLGRRINKELDPVFREAA
ncbi:MAG TPA: hypothetical protein VGR48_16810, partial [Terriglobales bacterium]|nr:hypothetical protein [Terriglobales bacterium]